MTPKTLLAEGRRLARPCVFLRPAGSGPVAAYWHTPDAKDIEETGHRLWISVDTKFIPGLSQQASGFISVLTNERECQGGLVETRAVPLKKSSIELHAAEESVLAPIEAIFSLGNVAIGEWLAANNWPREERYNDNFPDRAVVEVYERQWQQEYPFYRNDGTFAVLGGWHCPWADDDWYQLMNEQLMVLTIKDSEPWVEAWHFRTGEFRVIQRIS